MSSNRSTRVKSGLLAGLLAGGILFGIIWLFGYITGNRLEFPLLIPLATIVGVIAGAQAFITDSDGKASSSKSASDDPVELLRKQAEERARRRS